MGRKSIQTVAISGIVLLQGAACMRAAWARNHLVLPMPRGWSLSEFRPGMEALRTFHARRPSARGSRARSRSGSLLTVLIDPRKTPKAFRGVSPGSKAPRAQKDWGLSYGPLPSVQCLFGQLKMQPGADGLDFSTDWDFPSRTSIHTLLGNTHSRQGRGRESGKDGGKEGGKTGHGGKRSAIWSMGFVLSPEAGGRREEGLSPRPYPGLSLGAFFHSPDFDVDGNRFFTASAWWRGRHETLKLEWLNAKTTRGLRSNLSQGIALNLGYEILPSWEGVARYERYQSMDGMRSVSDASTLGANFIVTRRLRLHAAYSWLTNMTGNVSTYTPAGASSSGASKGAQDSGRYLVTALQLTI